MNIDVNFMQICILYIDYQINSILVI